MDEGEDDAGGEERDLSNSGGGKRVLEVPSMGLNFHGNHQDLDLLAIVRMLHHGPLTYITALISK